MKIVHIIGGPSRGGGAEKGTLNLHMGLRSIGVDSTLIYGRYSPNCSERIGLEQSLMKRVQGIAWRRWEMLQNRIYGVPPRSAFGLGWHGHGIKSWWTDTGPDLIHLHWPHQAVVDFSYLRKVQIPIVWTMRDFWAFTGGCHYAMGCREFMHGCHKCPYIRRFQKWKPTARLVQKKNKLFRALNIQFVAISPWEAELARNSAVLNGCRVDMIPNCIDVSQFRPIAKDEARRKLGISADKIIYVAGAYDLGADHKGPKLLQRVAQLLKSNRMLVTFGGRGNLEKSENENCRHLGFINDAESLSVIYSAADVFLCTSVEEVFGKTVIESLACGTPAVVYREGGMASLLGNEDGVEAATELTAEAFMNSAEKLVQRGKLSPNAIGSINERFSNLVAARSYSDLYKTMISNGDRK